MRYSSIVFLLVALLPVHTAVAGQQLKTRPLDSVAVDAFERAMVRSALVRTMVKTLESTNVIVHIVSSRTLPLGIAGTTQFVTSRGGFRYLRITLSADLSNSMRAAILGHELRHACEVAQSSADDPEEIRKLFEREGNRAGHFYETRAAVEAERQVRSELESKRVLQAEPVVKFHH